MLICSVFLGEKEKILLLFGASFGTNMHELGGIIWVNLDFLGGLCRLEQLGDRAR